MTIKELIELFSTNPPDAKVVEERQSELRELHAADIESHESGSGHPFEDEEEETDGPIVIFRSWS